MANRATSARRGRSCLSCLFWLVAGGILAAAILALAGMLYQASAAAGDAAEYPPPGQMVDVGGYRLHLYCEGQGSPTVVFDSGLGDDSLVWRLVQPEVARFARACAYDRAGLGWSDPGPRPRTGEQMANELHTLLASAGESGPYVLVAHSFSGLTARLFASRYPGDVAGLVLVDASHEDQAARMPAGFDKIMARQRQLVQIMAVATRLGVPRVAGTLIKPLPANIDKLPAGVRPQALALLLRPERYNTAYQEQLGLDETLAQVRAGGTLGDRPLMVVSSSTTVDPATAGSMGGYPIAEANRVHLELQRELVGLSTRGNQLVTSASPHYIQVYQPLIVIDAIRQVVEAVRLQGP